MGPANSQPLQFLNILNEDDQLFEAFGESQYLDTFVIRAIRHFPEIPALVAVVIILDGSSTLKPVPLRVYLSADVATHLLFHYCSPSTVLAVPGPYLQSQISSGSKYAPQ